MRRVHRSIVDSCGHGQGSPNPSDPRAGAPARADAPPPDRHRSRRRARDRADRGAAGHEGQLEPARPGNLTGLSDVQAEFSGLSEKAGTIGQSGAKVTITEYGDLRCPICKTFDNDVVPTLVEDYVRTGKAKLRFSTWPILGPNSVTAAQAAYAAEQQNALWRYAALTYLNQGDESRAGSPRRTRARSPPRSSSTCRVRQGSRELRRQRGDRAGQQRGDRARLPGHAVDARDRPGRVGDRRADARRHPGGRAEGERHGRMSTRRIAACLALLELAIAIYLEVERARGRSVACPIGGGGCETVQQSSYSKLAGIPLPILGLAGAVAMFVTTLAERPARAHRGARAGGGGRAVLALPRRPAGLRDPRLLRVVPRERRRSGSRWP